jgi:hypothetical protein
MEGERQILFTSSHFPPNQFYQNLQFFPLTLKFYFTVVLSRFLHIPFSLAYKSRSRTLMSQVPPKFTTNSILLKISSLPWNYGVARGHILWAPSHTSKWRTDIEIIFGFYVDTTSSRWRPHTARGVRSSLSRSPSSLVLSHFSKLSHPGDFAISRPCFRWRTWNYMWRLLRNQRHFHLRLVFSSWRWTLSLVARSDSSIAS